MVYELLTMFQFTMVIICALFCAIVAKQRENAYTRTILCCAFLALFQNAGYLMELYAKTEEGAWIAVKLEYLASGTVVLFFFMFCMSFCEVKVPKWIFWSMFGWNCFVVLMVWTSKRQRLFYTSMEFVQGKYFPYLALGHGPVYFANFLFIYLEMLFCVLASFYIWHKTKIERKKKNARFMFFGLFIPLVGIPIQWTGSFGGFDCVPACIATCFVLFYIAIVKNDIFHIEDIAHAEIFRTMKEPMIILDEKYNALEANETARELFPILGNMEVGTAFPNTPLIAYAEYFGKDETFEIDDKTFRVQLNELFINGKLCGYTLVLIDLTNEQKRLEEMEILKEKAEKANNAKSDFLARMSHEIRTPINGILGMNEMILRESKDKQVKKYAVDVKTSANSLLAIINDILDASKIEAGKMELIEANYEIGSLLNDTYNMVSVRAKDKRLALEFKIDPEIPSVYVGDDIRIKQILINILGNAIKYTKEGRVTLQLSGERDGEYEVLHFAISDTGVGIKEEDIGRLFKKFERIDEQANRHIEGAGLGMNITIHLLELMHSELKVESEYGKGSCFSFTLRQKIVNQEPIALFKEKTVEKEYGYTPRFVAPKAHVLVVDDNEMNREVFENLLRPLQIQVSQASSGLACIDLIKQTHFDLIFLDHMMPEMDGIDTFRAMKVTEPNKSEGVPVIMLTANAIKGAKEEYMQEGFDEFLSKPIMPDKLEAILEARLPKEYVKYTDENVMVTTESLVSSLPEIDEIDLEYAMVILHDEKLLHKTLIDFYNSIPTMKEKLNENFEHLEEEKGEKEYRIAVHSLKSTSATVGAMLLSKLARLQENAVIAHELEKIRTLHPILMEEMDKHRERIKVVVPEEQEKSQGNLAEMIPYFEMLLQNLEDGNYSASDLVMSEILKYEYAGELKEKIDNLRTQIFNIETEEAIETIQDIMRQ